MLLLLRETIRLGETYCPVYDYCFLNNNLQIVLKLDITYEAQSIIIINDFETLTK